MEPLSTSQAQCYLFDPNTSQYEDKGLAGIAIVGEPGGPGTYRLGCYQGAEYLCTADITNNNDTGIQWSVIGTGYASFRDDNSRIWSVNFPGGDPELMSFSASIAVAMYGASNQPEGSVICCDVAQGKRDRIVVPGDKVKARYTSWVVQRRDPVTTTTPKLGSQLESNEADESAYVYAAPLNHNSVTSDMKGFEGMTIGMAEEARRFIVVPKAAKRGSAPNIHICYMVYVVKKKDNAAAEVEAFRSMQQNQQQSGGGGGRGGGGGGSESGQVHPGALVVPNSQNQQQQGQQPTVVVVHTDGKKNKNRGGDDDEDRDDDDNNRRERSNSSKHRNTQPRAPTPPSMPPPAPGFNFEQMDVVNRMRDQCANLLMQIKESTSRIDLFSHDMRQAISKKKPRSLGTAQMQHTLQSMLEESESMKDTLVERDKTLKQLEDRNKDLQGKVDAFSATAQRLSEEKKAAMSETSQVKLDGDQKALSLQSELTRIMSEREDTSRHLSSVKRLLEISDGDAKKEKQSLQTCEVQMTTVEAKMSSADENLIEERGKRKLLESKITTLGDELRSLLEEVRIKEAQIDERRRKMEADKLHYSQIMDEERERASEEMRELRDELVQEITVRDRRYQEERARVARESFERGRIQGVEDGHNEAAMEVDARMQMLSLEAQRHRSEVETIKVRLHQSHESAEASRRHQESHCSALGKVVDELQSEIHAAEVELRALDSTRVTAQQAAADAIKQAIAGITRPVSRSDLLSVMHKLRTNSAVDMSFEGLRENEERIRAEKAKEDAAAWVKRRVVAPVGPHTPQEPAPPLRTPWVEDQLTSEQQQQPSAPGVPGAEFLDGGLNSPLNPTGQVMRPDYVQEVEKRQRELLESLHMRDPTLELIVRPPTPPPPTPPPEPEPEPEPEHEVKVQPPVEEESDDADEGKGEAAAANSSKSAGPAAHQQQHDSSDDDDILRDAVSSSNKANKKSSVAAPAPKKKVIDDEDEDSDNAAKDDDDDGGYGVSDSNMGGANYADPMSNIGKDDIDEDEEEPILPPRKHGAERKKLAKPPIVVDEEEEEEEAAAEQQEQEQEEEEEEEQQVEEPEAEEEEEEEEKPVARPAAPAVNKKAAAAPAQRQAALFAADDSDDDSDGGSFGQRPAAQKKGAATSSSAAAAPVASKTGSQQTATKGKPATTAAKPTPKLFGGGGSSDDDSDDEKPVFRVAAARTTSSSNGKKQAAAPPASKPAAKRGGLFAESDSDDDDDDAPVAAPARPAAKPAAAPKTAAAGKKAMPAPKKSLFAASDSDD